MTKETFHLKLTNFIFILLLSFSLLHFWGEVRMFMKPVFLFAVGLTGLLFFIRGKFHSSTIVTNLMIQAFILLLFLQFYFQWDIEMFPYLFPLALFIFYKVSLSFLAINKNSNKSTQIITTYIAIISIEIMLFVLSKTFPFLTFCPNKSIFSILIAAQLLFISPYLKKHSTSFTKNKKRHTLFLICYVFLSYCLLFYTKGRAGIFGFTIGLGVLNYSYLKSKVGYLKGVIIAACLLVLLLNFKSNSSSGRLLIYKVITTQLEPSELITGIGYGKFKVRYNELQANYFSKKSINNNEALLADNTYYMFNDPLQFIIETGLVGLLFYASCPCDF